MHYDASMDCMKTMGIRIRESRAERGISQKHLADLCGIDQTHISRYENGAVEPKASSLARIARALPGVTMEWLVFGSDLDDASEDS